MKIKLTIYGLALISTAFAQAKIEALEMLHDYDTIYQGGKVQHDFKFVNTGNEPLIIHHAKTSCGCDVATWPKEPIMPGDTASVNYKYDSNRIGMINKTMTVSSNAVNTPIITVRNKGYILPKK